MLIPFALTPDAFAYEAASSPVMRSHLKLLQHFSEGNGTLICHQEQLHRFFSGPTLSGKSRYLWQTFLDHLKKRKRLIHIESWQSVPFDMPPVDAAALDPVFCLFIHPESYALWHLSEEDSLLQLSERTQVCRLDCAAESMLSGSKSSWLLPEQTPIEHVQPLFRELFLLSQEIVVIDGYGGKEMFVQAHPRQDHMPPQAAGILRFLSWIQHFRSPDRPLKRLKIYTAHSVNRSMKDAVKVTQEEILSVWSDANECPEITQLKQHIQEISLVLADPKHFHDRFVRFDNYCLQLGAGMGCFDSPRRLAKQLSMTRYHDKDQHHIESLLRAQAEEVLVWRR